MKRNWAVRSLLVTGLLVVAETGVAFAEEPSIDAPARNMLRIWPPSALHQAPTVNDRSLNIFRQAPTLSGRVHVNEQTLIPYIGAGFGGGYVTERDRALSPQPALPQQNVLGDSLGKGIMPNEFQMGIRIPF